jgi:phage shock protein C
MTTHLYRSVHDRMLAGVAGGLAELWDADPSLVRIIWALLVPLTGGIALVVYIVMASVVPEEDDPRVWTSPTAGTSAPTPPADPASAGPMPASPPTPSPVPAMTDASSAIAPVTAAPTGQPWPASRFEERTMRREARHQARLERRARRTNDGHSGALIVGTLFILVGAWYLVRQYLPGIDWEWFWPMSLVALGIVILYLAVRPAPATPRTDETSERSVGS